MVLMTLLVFLNSVLIPVLEVVTGELKIFKPHSNNNVRAHSFACRHANCWNELPETTRNAESLSSFKRLVAKFDFSNFFSKLLIVLYYVYGLS